MAAILIAGPTASGKSALALALARAFNGTVINADSMQVYREIPVISARPTAEEEALIPHRLFGVWPAAEAGSVGKWQKAALAAVAEVHANNRLPVIVGGTGLYFRALLEGIAPIPPVPADIRHETATLYEQLGGDAFRSELARHDPATAARLGPSDRQRLTRAYEVWRATGRALSDWQTEPGAGALSCRTFTILLDPPRAELYAAIDARVERMLAAGALQEVRQLLTQGLSASLPAMKAVGVRELAEVLAGRCDLATAQAAMAQASRRYAKRQWTWFRNQLSSNLLLQESLWTKDSEYLEAKIFPLIRDFLLTGG